MSKLTARETKLHYKMFKAGKFWVFMSLSSALLIGGVATTAHASTDESSTDAATETSTDSSSTPDSQATLRTTATTEAEVTPTDASSSETPAPTNGNPETPADTATPKTTTEITEPAESAKTVTPTTDTIAKDEAPQADTDKLDSTSVTSTPTATKKVVRVDAVSQQATDAVTNLHLDVLVGQSNTVEPGEVDVQGNRYYRLGIDGAFNISADDLTAGKRYDIATLTVLPDPSDPALIVPLKKDGADVGASVFDGNKNGNEIGSIVLSGNKLVFTVSDKYDPTQHALIGDGFLAFNGPWIMTINWNTDPAIIKQMPFSNTLTVTNPQNEVINSYKFNFQAVNTIPLTKWQNDFLSESPSADNVKVDHMVYQQVIPNAEVLAQLQASNGKTGDTIQKDAYQFAYKISADKLYKLTGGEFETWGFVANSESNQLVRVDNGDEYNIHPFYITTISDATHEAPDGTSLQDLEALNFDGMAYSLQADGSYLVYYNFSAKDVSIATTGLSTSQSVEAQFDTSVDAADQATKTYYSGAMNDIPPVFQIITSFDFENEFVPNTTTVSALDLTTGKVLKDENGLDKTYQQTSVPNGIQLSTNAVAVYHYLDIDTGQYLSPAQRGTIYKPTGTNTETAPTPDIPGYEMLQSVPAGYTLPDKVTGNTIAADSLTVSLPQTEGVITDYYVLYQTARTTNHLNKTVTQTINYLDAKDHSIVVAPANTQSVDLTATELLDAATGDLIGYDTNADRIADTKVLAEAWLPATTKTAYDAVTSPAPTDYGYDTVDKAVIAGSTVTGATENTVINVLYDHNSTSMTTESKTVTRTINYLDKDTNAVVAPAVPQTATFTRTVTTDDTTHVATTSDWNLANQSLAEVTSPDLSAAGYQAPDQTIVAALTVTPDSENTVVNVYYQKKATTPTGPTEPTEPGNPTDPDTPENPTEPTGPDNPVTPTEPTGPINPTGPDTPATPTTPTEPAMPNTPITPTVPTTPVQPTSPETATTPGTAEPGTGIDSRTPAPSTETNSTTTQSNQTNADSQSANTQQTVNLAATSQRPNLRTASTASQTTAQTKAATLPQTREARYAQASLAGWLLLSVAGFLGIEVKKRRER